MSRGPGRIQRYIMLTLQITAERDPEKAVLPVRTLAGMWAKQTGVPFTPALASSFRRAANRLLDEEQIEGGTLRIPTLFDSELVRLGEYQDVLVVGTHDAKWGDDTFWNVVHAWRKYPHFDEPWEDSSR